MENTDWTVQIISLIGAFLVLIAYIGHQLKWKVFDPNNYLYNLFNSIAAIFLTYSAFKPFQAGFILMESVWGIVSFYTLFRVYKNRLK